VPTILHLITGLDTGGAELMLARLVARPHPTRHHSLVVSMIGPGRLGPALQRAGVEVRSLGMSRGWPDPRGLARLVALLRRVRPQILQTWLYHADLLGLVAHRLAGVSSRLFWNIQCTEMADAGLVRRLLAWSSAAPEAIVVNSLAGRHFHEAVGYRPQRWEHIPNGCDTSAFLFDTAGRRSLRDEWGAAEDAVVVGLPARYHAMKDHNNFLAAAALFAARRTDAVFVLAGAGAEPGNRALSSSIAAHGLDGRIRLLGNRSDMVRVYSALDIASLASAYGEGCPNVLVEAMACGVPCVATDCGDAALLIGADGLIVPPRAPAALAAAWERVTALGRAGRRQLGNQARQRMVSNYDIAVIGARYDALYG
jgi:glycosyltransferase involved in cell wall biosynthesis